MKTMLLVEDDPVGARTCGQVEGQCLQVLQVIKAAWIDQELDGVFGGADQKMQLQAIEILLSNSLANPSKPKVARALAP